MGIDQLDAEILETVGNETYWKNKIHQEMETDCSVREIGKRVDELVEAGYLESTIIEPVEISPELIIAFKRTDRGFRGKDDGEDR